MKTMGRDFTEILTAAQMRAVERAGIASGRVSALELMERAGESVLAAMLEEWPRLAGPGCRAVVFCGPGNNGGDGFVVARLLKARGWEASVFLFGDPDKLPSEARRNYELWRGSGPVGEFRSTPWNRLLSETGEMVVIDALFGTGLSRAFADFPGAVGWKSLADRAGAHGLPARRHLVAVDLPSGLCSDSGRVLLSSSGSSACIPASLTVTFQTAKLGHFLGDGPAYCGKLVVSDIGLSSWQKILPPEAQDSAPVRLVANGDGFAPLLAKTASRHKYGHGHALILAGGPGAGGAARLAARGALRIGAGLVTVGCPPDALPENAAQLTSVMTNQIADGEVLRQVLRDRRINALCLGPGLGRGRARELLTPALASARPTVLDADALTAFADGPATLFEMLHGGCVLTPHGGEFARLFPDIAQRLARPATRGPAFSKVDATRAAAARAGCVVLFKGADTVIAAPDGRCALHAAFYGRSAPWLATAGSGDVLAGFVAGLLARHVAPFEAAEAAVWLHAECARQFGPGLVAGDLPEALPDVFRALGL